MCRPCHLSCKNCIDSSSTSCTECRAQYYFDQVPQDHFDPVPPIGFTQSTCTLCPIGYLYTHQRSCGPCHINCLTCIEPNNPLKCTNCVEPLLYSFATEECLEACYPYQFVKTHNSFLYCESCHPDCEGCFGDLNTECVGCKPYVDENSLAYLIVGENKCETSCPGSGYFEILSQPYKCFKCHSSCLECDGADATNCLKCRPEDNYYIEMKMCLANCPETTFASEDPLTLVKKCRPCEKNCAVCTGPLALEC